MNIGYNDDIKLPLPHLADLDSWLEKKIIHHKIRWYSLSDIKKLFNTV